MIAELPASRRNLMKGLAVTAMAATLVPLDWALSRRAALAGPTSEYTAGNCDPPFGDYIQERNNWWGDGRAICFGGWRMGSYPCSGGFHFEGSRTHKPGASDQERYTNVVRIATSCGGRNAWRWANGAWRCSDAMTTVTWRDGTYHRGLTIAMCAV